MNIHDLDEDEMDYQEEEDNRSYLPNPFKIIWQALLSIKKIISIGCTLILLAFFALILIIIFRPDPLWNPIKNFLNEGYVSSNMPQEPEYVIGEELVISESELAFLIQKNLDTELLVATEINPGEITVLINIDSSENPLWVKAKVEVSESGVVELSDIGLIRFNLPEIVTNMLDEVLIKLLDLFNSEDIDNVLEQLFAEEFRIFDVRIEEEHIILQTESR